MNVSQLVSKTYAKMENNTTFWTREEVILNGLNPAQRLLMLYKPELIVTKTTISLSEDQCFYDLRTSGTNLLVRLQRVIVGDATTDPVTPSQGRFYRLRTATINGLRTKGDWLKKRAPYPTHYARYGMFWLVIYPRQSLSHTLTLIANAIPAALGTGLESGNTEVDIPESWNNLLPEIAAALLLLKEGAGESSESIRMLSSILSKEDIEGITKKLASTQKKIIYGKK